MTDDYNTYLQGDRKNQQWHCFLCLVTLTSDPKINVFPRLMVEHFYVTFGDSSCSSLWDIVQVNRQTDRQTDTGEESALATARYCCRRGQPMLTSHHLNIDYTGSTKFLLSKSSATTEPTLPLRMRDSLSASLSFIFTAHLMETSTWRSAWLKLPVRW